MQEGLKERMMEPNLVAAFAEALNADLRRFTKTADGDRVAAETLIGLYSGTGRRSACLKRLRASLQEHALQLECGNIR